MAEQPPRKRSRPRDSAPTEPPAPRTRRKVRTAATTPPSASPSATPPAPRRRTRAAPKPAAVVVTPAEAPASTPDTPPTTAREPATAPVVAPPPPSVPPVTLAGEEPAPTVVEAPLAEEDLPLAEPVEPTAGAARRGRDHAPDGRSNALGTLIERRFADPTSPVRSYSDLERRSGVSREALSRYVTSRADRRRSPTIETLAAIADALRISLEQVCRAAVAGAHGLILPDVVEQRAREEVLMPLAGTLNDRQFDALVELLRQLQRSVAGG